MLRSTNETELVCLLSSDCLARDLNCLPLVFRLFTAKPKLFTSCLQIIYRKTEPGNLKQFLQQCSPLVTRDVVSLGLQLLRALSYLHSAKLLHNDVATRNCVVDTSLQVTISGSVWYYN